MLAPKKGKKKQTNKTKQNCIKGLLAMRPVQECCYSS